MYYLACDSSITLSTSGSPECTSGWLVVPEDSLAQKNLVLAESDFYLLWSMLVPLLVLGGCIKILKSVFTVANYKGV